MSQFSRNASLWLLVFVLVLLFYNMMHHTAPNQDEIPYSEFRGAIEQGKISEVLIKDNEIVGEFKEGYGTKSGKFLTHVLPGDTDLVKDLRTAGVKFDSSPKEQESIYLTVLGTWLPMIVLILIWVFFMRQIQVGGGKAMNFGKSRARLMEEGQTKVTFADVAGVDESKNELEAIVKFLKDPKKFTKLGGRIPKGVLLVGNPGTGKTLLAKAIAGEAGVPFFSISGSDFVEMFVGVGASRVRDLFMRAKKNAPCIIFIDEIDAVGRHRGAGLGGGHDEREQTLNQLLVEMDGFEMNEGVILVAATNRPDVLDPALLRPGRFDRTVVVPLPDLKGREAILKVHTGKVPLGSDVELEKIARGTPGFSGADLANLVNEAALNAALMDQEIVKNEHFEYAKDRIVMGIERKSLLLSEDDKKVIAYHESGHALVARLLPTAEPVHKVTIIPRGMALGLMQQLPERDQHNFSKDYWLNRICIAFGGRAAEELIFSEITTGASSDISVATGIARRMVCEWGMSEKMGPLSYGKKDDMVFLGREISHQRDYSENTAMEIDAEIRALVDTQLERARMLLRTNRDKLDRLAKNLLEHETLDAAQIDAVIEGREIEPGGSGGGGGGSVEGVAIAPSSAGCESPAGVQLSATVTTKV